MSRTSETYGTTLEGLTFCFIFLHPEINRKNMMQKKKYIWRNTGWKLSKFNEKHKPIAARGLVNLKWNEKPNEIHAQTHHNQTVDKKTKKKILKNKKTKPINDYLNDCVFLMRDYSGQKEVRQCLKYVGGKGVGDCQSRIQNLYPSPLFWEDFFLKALHVIENCF